MFPGSISTELPRSKISVSLPSYWLPGSPHVFVMLSADWLFRSRDTRAACWLAALMPSHVRAGRTVNVSLSAERSVLLRYDHQVTWFAAWARIGCLPVTCSPTRDLIGQISAVDNSMMGSEKPHILRGTVWFICRNSIVVWCARQTNLLVRTLCATQLHVTRNCVNICCADWPTALLSS